MDESDPVEAAQAIINELEEFSPALAARERWLVLNKMDLIPEDEREALQERIVSELGWEGPVYCISAISSDGTQRMCQDIMNFIEARNLQESEDIEFAQAEAEQLERMEEEARLRIQELAEARRARRMAEKMAQMEEGDDDHGVEVFYVH